MTDLSKDAANYGFRVNPHETNAETYYTLIRQSDGRVMAQGCRDTIRIALREPANYNVPQDWEPAGYHDI